MMKHKHIFYAALTCRLTSFVSLGVFLFCMYKDLSSDLLLTSLGLSFAAWVMSTAFVHFYKEALAKQIIGMMVAKQNAVEALGEDIANVEEEYANHPIFAIIEENLEDKDDE